VILLGGKISACENAERKSTFICQEHCKIQASTEHEKGRKNLEGFDYYKDVILISDFNVKL